MPARFLTVNVFSVIRNFLGVYFPVFIFISFANFSIRVVASIVSGTRLASLNPLEDVLVEVAG